MPISKTQAPLITAFVGSLLLSLIALYFNPILARDSILYLDIANNFSVHGYDNPTGRFNWPWISVFISGLHQLTGLSTINAGLLLMLVLMACTCTLLTRTSQLIDEDSAWWACLISLSIPAFNNYRDSILREPGQWLAAALVMLSLILWQQQNRWRHLLLALAAIATGILFRLEAVFMLLPLAIALVWQLRSSLFNRRGLILIAAAAFLLMLTGSLIAFSGLVDNTRVTYYASLLNPGVITDTLDANARVLVDGVLEKYSHDDAATILVLGFSGLIVMKALLMNGPFLMVLALSPSSIFKRPGNALEVFIFSAALCYLLILLIFSLQHSFMIDRYVSLLHVLATPLLAAGAVKLQQRYHKLGKLLIVLAIVTGLANVVSLSDKRTHYLDAGQWIQSNIPAEARTYYSDGRVSFYAGRHYAQPLYDEEVAMQRHFSRYDYFVIDNLKDHPKTQQLLSEGTLELLAEFDNGKRRHLSVLRKTH